MRVYKDVRDLIERYHVHMEEVSNWPSESGFRKLWCDAMDELDDADIFCRPSELSIKVDEDHYNFHVVGSVMRLINLSYSRAFVNVRKLLWASRGWADTVIHRMFAAYIAMAEKPHPQHIHDEIQLTLMYFKPLMPLMETRGTLWP